MSIPIPYAIGIRFLCYCCRGLFRTFLNRKTSLIQFWTDSFYFPYLLFLLLVSSSVRLFTRMNYGAGLALPHSGNGNGFVFPVNNIKDGLLAGSAEPPDPEADYVEKDPGARYFRGCIEAAAIVRYL
ncbi:unnamed protein product [Ilex paraguariensis]|uniref:Uncharacterized protein n=1 Tax=Ilex paraguariensis TaxID=185542 RepID=A0ABC8TD68_9AQUA